MITALDNTDTAYPRAKCIPRVNKLLAVFVNKTDLNCLVNSNTPLETAESRCRVKGDYLIIISKVTYEDKARLYFHKRLSSISEHQRTSCTALSSLTPSQQTPPQQQHLVLMAMRS